MPSPRSRPIASLAALLAAAAFATCGSGAGGEGGTPAPAPSCRVTPAPGTGAATGVDPAAGDPLVLGLVHAIDPGAAPVPRNPGEALVFRHLYETLFRVDCRGRPYPGLAVSWEAEDGGRRWSFVLREDARFWDGEPLTARAVAEGWARGSSGGTLRRRGGGPRSVEVVGERRLRLVFDAPRPELPTSLSRLRWAVVRRTEEGPWPVVGTGPYRVGAVDDGGRALRPFADPISGLELVPVRWPGGEAAPGGPSLRIRIEPGADPRDLVDAGVDLLVTGDPGTLAYARSRSDVRTYALPWSRSYALVTPSPDAHGPGGDREIAGALDAFRNALATDVVRAEARPAGGSGGGWGRCAPAGEGAGTAREAAVGRRIVYPAGDAAARQLAERLVALTAVPIPGAGEEGSLVEALGLPPGGGIVASPLGSRAFRRALRRGDETAYIVAGAAGGAAGCPLRTTGTAEEGPGADSSSADSVRYRFVPLVETRRRLVARRPAPEVWVDGDGTPVVRGRGGEW